MPMFQATYSSGISVSTHLSKKLTFADTDNVTSSPCSVQSCWAAAPLHTTVCEPCPYITLCIFFLTQQHQQTTQAVV